ncbi:hypothetical protein BT96DRAFT_924224 [Gymnopus androsaceus JB14]|uniref:Uncharacterized protein n=1 Tax=Gymnopus androsaceus JB14 TaxID=1447944 RepID=A0A6A4H636_9AGAR|nr:hypothetical protein BT96DRAFT_924224 [Gymnopus androsaceus JB14]
MHMLYAAQQRLDGYEEAVVHAQKRKSLFDKKAMASREELVEFQKGDLGSISKYSKLACESLLYGSEAGDSLVTRVAEKLKNSYELVWRDGESRADLSTRAAFRISKPIPVQSRGKSRGRLKG